MEEQISIEELNTAIQYRDKLDRLMANKDFKDIILKYYLEDSVLAISSNLSRIKPENRNLLVEQLIARNSLRGFLEDIINQGMNAKAELADIQANKSNGEND